MCELLLPDASTYYWRVAAIDADGDSSIFSEPQSVQKETAKPVAKRAISSEAQSSPVIAPPNPVSINQIRFGMGTGYSFEKYSSANLGVKANGFVPLRFHSLIQFDYFRLWDLRLLLQKIQYRSQDAAILDFNSPSDVTTGKVELLGRGVFNFKKVPLNLGWAVYVHPYVQRLAPETIQFKTAISTGPVVGTSWSWGTIFGATLQSDAMLQAELLGRIQGVGLVHRGSAEWRKLSRTWIPRVEWFTNPYYRSTPSGISLFGFESGVFFQAAILLGGERNSRLESGALR
jgi:hypothetical protein